jgi:hypothetical protein
MDKDPASPVHKEDIPHKVKDYKLYTKPPTISSRNEKRRRTSVLQPPLLPKRPTNTNQETLLPSNPWPPQRAKLSGFQDTKCSVNIKEDCASSNSTPAEYYGPTEPEYA